MYFVLIYRAIATLSKLNRAKEEKSAVGLEVNALYNWYTKRRDSLITELHASANRGKRVVIIRALVECEIEQSRLKLALQQILNETVSPPSTYIDILSGVHSYDEMASDTIDKDLELGVECD